MKRLVVLFVFVLWITLGCAPTAPTSSAGVAGGGAKLEKAPNPDLDTVTSKDGSFTIQVPKNWVIASRSEPKFVDALKKVGKDDLLTSIEKISSESYFRLMVMDLGGIAAKKEFVNNLNVVVFPVSGPDVGKDMKAAAEEAAKQVFGTAPHATSVVDTPNGKVGKYSGATSLGSGSPHDLIGGVLVHDGHAYTISLSAAEGDKAKFDAQFDEIVSSIKFK